MQLEVWQKRQKMAEEGTRLVCQALARLEAHREPSLHVLCKLVRTMEARNLSEVTREVIHESISADEQRAWMTWWGRQPAKDVQRMQQYALAQRALLTEFARAGYRPTRDYPYVAVQTRGVRCMAVPVARLESESGRPKARQARTYLKTL